jgi:hypothetical protein
MEYSSHCILFHITVSGCTIRRYDLLYIFLCSHHQLPFLYFRRHFSILDVNFFHKINVLWNAAFLFNALSEYYLGIIIRRKESKRMANNFVYKRNFDLASVLQIYPHPKGSTLVWNQVLSIMIVSVIINLDGGSNCCHHLENKL